MNSRVAVMQALRSIKDPESEKDIVSLNFIADVKIEDANVTVQFRPDTMNSSLLDQFTAEIKRAVLEVEGVQKVDVVIEQPDHNEAVEAEQEFGGVQDLNHVKKGHCCNERKGRGWQIAGKWPAGSDPSQKRIPCGNSGRGYHGSEHPKNVL
jgi:Predicted metal-sulfur cluster biosynthetic enzyme